MTAPSAGHFGADLLQLWESGQDLSPAERALSMLRLWHPDREGIGPGALSIGERDRRLLELRGRLFGPTLVGVVDCPACGESLESRLEIDEVCGTGGGPVADKVTIMVDRYKLICRVPTGDDLVAVTADGENADPLAALLARCIVSARTHGRPVAVDSLPDTVLAALGERLSQADPLAEVEIALSCPACGARWAAPLDIASFLWREIEAWSMRVLLDIHTLAAAYGWPEADILALSPMRRALFVQMVHG